MFGHRTPACALLRDLCINELLLILGHPIFCALCGKRKTNKTTRKSHIFSLALQKTMVTKARDTELWSSILGTPSSAQSNTVELLCNECELDGSSSEGQFSNMYKMVQQDHHQVCSVN